MRFRSPVVVSAAVLALSLSGAAGARPSARHASMVKVTAKEYSFALSTKTVRAGQVTFAIKNMGQTAHDFAIAGHASKVVGPGQRTTLTVDLKRGHHSFKCTIDSHAQLGMKGVLDVT